ncbi:hypothetical protein TNCV_4985641 [Trichonephila clavipes]|nr:hypothetical protein TNCV_4985641 [Trichonephila clavipes]
MVEHLVIGLKTSPNHIGLGSALETGGWQFIDQHGHMRRLNQVNLCGFHRSQAKVWEVIILCPINIASSVKKIWATFQTWIIIFLWI